MIKKVFLITFSLLLFMLAGCAKQSNTLTPTGGYSSCKAMCTQKAQQCAKTCRNSCPQCVTTENINATVEYQHYRHEQFVKGITVARELNSYKDPLACRKTTCNCVADYNVCIQSCGGVIHKQLQAAPVCQ